MGEDNLTPYGQQSVDKARENGRKGGINSGIARREQSEAKKAIQMILNAKTNPKLAEQVARNAGIKNEEVTNSIAMAYGLYSRAIQGDSKAYETIQKYGGELSQNDERSLLLKEKELEIKEEQFRIEKEQYEQSKINHNEEYKGIPVLDIAPVYAQLQHDINAKNYKEYLLFGGRGSGKSSVIGIDIVDLIEKNSDYNALVVRKVGNTITDSVYNQIVWAIDLLGLSNQYRCVRRPAEITKLSTGQKIYFRGADEPAKIKSIKAVHGYISILWFEELDQFNGEEEIRNIRQSAIRGGDDSFVFMSFNPPKSPLNWANKYTKVPKESRYMLKSDYTQVPREWLGQAFIDEADWIKEVNPDAYEHEYMGIANGNGGNVFDNVEVREITEAEKKQFDPILHGVDWGWYPDPFQYVKCYYDSARLTLYIFDEYRCNKKGNEETARILMEDYGVGSDLVTCDSAEEKSVQDYRVFGISARGAEKGAGSVDYSMKWLARLNKIIIDPSCKNVVDEFINYEYERDKEGNVITGYPDKNNHAIDAVRYATNSIWKKRGQ